MSAGIINLDVKPKGNDLELVVSSDSAPAPPAEEKAFQYLGRWIVIAEEGLGVAFRCGLDKERLYVFTVPVSKQGVSPVAYELAEKRLFASLGMYLGQQIAATRHTAETAAEVPNVVHNVTIMDAPEQILQGRTQFGDYDVLQVA